MKKLLMFALVTTFAFGATALVATDADARAKGQGIVGSAHDFTDNLRNWGASVAVVEGSEEEVWTHSSTDTTGTYSQEAGTGGWNYRGEICRVCHAPHDKGRAAWSSWGSEVGETGLLWNHMLSDTDAYPMYTSSSLEGAISNNVIGKSKLCLSCHDGTVALNAFDGQQNGLWGGNGDAFTYTAGDKTTGTYIQGFSNGFTIGPERTGSDTNFLMGTHPISVAYTAGYFPLDNPKLGRAGGLNDPDRFFGNVVEMNLAPTIAMTLEQGMVQCHSCHDVHDSVGVNAIGTRLNRAGQGLAANRGGDPSGLCLSCHNK